MPVFDSDKEVRMVLHRLHGVNPHAYFIRNGREPIEDDLTDFSFEDVLTPFGREPDVVEPHGPDSTRP